MEHRTATAQLIGMHSSVARSTISALAWPLPKTALGNAWRDQHPLRFLFADGPAGLKYSGQHVVRLLNSAAEVSFKDPGYLGHRARGIQQTPLTAAARCTVTLSAMPG